MEVGAADATEILVEPHVKISEYGLFREGDEAKVEDAILSGKSFKRVGELKTQITKVYRRNKVLRTPLHRQAEERTRRSVAYEQECKQLNDWTEFVHESRVADNVIFPLLNSETEALKIVRKTVRSLPPRTPFEIEMEQALQENQSNVEKECDVTEEEKNVSSEMRMEEAKEALDQLCRYRARVTYQEAKNRRHKKIKSKRYHRILKQQQRRRLLKEFKDLMEKDPVGAKAKLEELEKDRIIERATLRHTGTGTWARKMITYAKRNTEVRNKIQEQIRFSRELIAKLGHAHELVEEAPKSDDEEIMMNSATETVPTNEKASTSAVLDLDAKVAPVVLEDRMDFGEQETLMAEAFEDDDVIAEFAEENDNNRQKEEKLNTRLLGWNSWVGPGCQDSTEGGEGKEQQKEEEKSQKRFAEEKTKKRRVIFHKNCGRTIKDKQVNVVPFPFLSEEAFERTVGNPLGKEWNPSTAHSLMIEPAVTTKMGRIIRPADRGLLVNRDDDDEDDRRRFKSRGMRRGKRKMGFEKQ